MRPQSHAPTEGHLIAVVCFVRVATRARRGKRDACGPAAGEMPANITAALPPGMNDTFATKWPQDHRMRWAAFCKDHPTLPKASSEAPAARRRPPPAA
jgi:hypothetical protein